MDIVNCNFQELKPHLDSVAHISEDSVNYTLKTFDEELDTDLIVTEDMLEMNRASLKELDKLVKKARNAGFYKRVEEVIVKKEERVPSPAKKS